MASYGLHFFLDAPSPGTSELVASLFMMVALLVLSPLHHLPALWQVAHQLDRSFGRGLDLHGKMTEWSLSVFPVLNDPQPLFPFG